MSKNTASFGTLLEDGLRVGKFFNAKYNIDIFGNVLAPGLYCAPITAYQIQPVTANPAGIALAQIPTKAGYLTLVDPIVQLDCARILSITGVLGTTAANYTVYGTDYYNNPVGELITGPVGVSTVVSNKTYSTITGIYCSAGTAENISVGWEDTFGLPFYLPPNRNDYIVQAFWGGQIMDISLFNSGDNTNPATATTYDVRGSVITPSGSNNVNWLTFYMMPPGFLPPSCLQTLINQVGVPQFIPARF